MGLKLEFVLGDFDPRVSGTKVPAHRPLRDGKESNYSKKGPTTSPYSFSKCSYSRENSSVSFMKEREREKKIV